MTVKVIVSVVVTTLEILSLITMAVTELFFLTAFIASITLVMLGTIATEFVSFLTTQLSTPLYGPQTTALSQTIFFVTLTVLMAGFFDAVSYESALVLQSIP